MRLVNVKLLSWLLSTTLVLIVGVHFLHGYQIKRNAIVVLNQAQTDKRAGNRKEAAKEYLQYLKYRPDDTEVYEEFANMMVDIASQPGHTGRDVFKAWEVLEEAVRRHPELTKLRRRLVDYTMEVNRPFDAIKHIEELRNSEQPNAALEVKYAQCQMALGHEKEALKLLSNLVGYDVVAEKFQSAKPPSGPHEVEAYVRLAQILRRKHRDNPAAADRVIEQMVAVNKDSAKAYLERAHYSLQFHSGEHADEDAQKALELAPDDEEAILLGAELAMSAKEYSQARELLERGIKKHPKSERMYYDMSRLAVSETKRMDEALGYVQDGLKQLPESAVLLQIMRTCCCRKGI